jgi:chromosome segregation ATPase
MDSINTLLPILGWAAVATGGAASLFALFRSKYIKATLEELRGDRDDQAVRIQRLEKERDELERGNIRRDAIIEQLTSQNDTLKDALSGKAQLNHLQAQLDAHDKRVDDRHAALTKTMLEVVVSNEALSESVAEKLQSMIDSNNYTQGALLDFLKKGEPHGA